MPVLSVRLNGEPFFTWEGDIEGLQSDFLDLWSRSGRMQPGVFARTAALILPETGLPDDPGERAVTVQALAHFALQQVTYCPELNEAAGARLDEIELDIWERENGPRIYISASWSSPLAT